MIRRRTVASLALLCGILFCALAAQSAWAAKGVNTTGFTCVEAPGNGDFNDPHCDSPNAEKKGNFTHASVNLNEKVPLNGTNEKVTNETKEREPVSLKAQAGLTKVELSCEKFGTTTTKSTFDNAETEGKHTFTGNGTALITQCAVQKPAKCTVKEPIEAAGNFEGVEKLGAAENEMGVEFKGAGKEETFAEITFQGLECALKETTFTVKGSAIGTAGPTTESSQTNEATGATIAFTPKKEMEKMKFGTNSAEVSVIVTATGAEGAEAPISITTVT